MRELLPYSTNGCSIDMAPTRAQRGAQGIWGRFDRAIRNRRPSPGLSVERSPQRAPASADGGHDGDLYGGDGKLDCRHRDALDRRRPRRLSAVQLGLCRISLDPGGDDPDLRPPRRSLRAQARVFTPGPVCFWSPRPCAGSPGRWCRWCCSVHCRGRAPAPSSRSRRQSSATSMSRKSAPAFRATSRACSASRRSSARCSARFWCST